MKFKLKVYPTTVFFWHYLTIYCFSNCFLLSCSKYQLCLVTIWVRGTLLHWTCLMINQGFFIRIENKHRHFEGFHKYNKFGAQQLRLACWIRERRIWCKWERNAGLKKTYYGKQLYGYGTFKLRQHLNFGSIQTSADTKAI